MCMILCANYVNYICGRMYTGNANTRVEKRNLRSSVMRIKTQRRSIFLPRGDGPFQVLKRINDNAYKLDLPSECGPA